MVKEELTKMMEKSSFGGAVKSIKKGAKAGSSASKSLDKSMGEIGAAAGAIARTAASVAGKLMDDDTVEDATESAPGPRKKVLRKKDGKTQIVRKRKKKLPLHMRTIKPSQAKRIARKSAIKRKGKQARISKKAAKTTKKGRAMGLYKKPGR